MSGARDGVVADRDLSLPNRHLDFDRALSALSLLFDVVSNRSSIGSQQNGTEEKKTQRTKKRENDAGSMS